MAKDWRLFHLIRSPDHKTLPQVLTRDEVARFLDGVKEPRFRMVLRLIYACGLRISEAVKLETGDIKDNRILIRQGKGNKDRYIPLAPSILTELRSWWKEHRHPRFLFPAVGRGWKENRHNLLSRSDEPMSIGSIQLCFRMVAAQTGISKKASVHTLRHSYATHLLEAGVSLRQIGSYLGHVSMDTTVIYTHLTTVSEAKALKAIEGLIPH